MFRGKLELKLDKIFDNNPFLNNTPLYFNAISDQWYKKDKAHSGGSRIANTAQKMKFSIKDFFSKCDQIRRKLRI